MASPSPRASGHVLQLCCDGQVAVRTSGLANNQDFDGRSMEIEQQNV